MKKKLLVVAMLIIAMVCLFAISASATEVGGVYYTLDSDRTATVNTKNQQNTATDIVIPSTITYDGVEYKVDAIANDAFNNNDTVVSIKILSEHITKIPERTFCDTYNGTLSKVYINFSNITSIGTYGLNNSERRNDNTPVGENRVYFYDAEAYIADGSDVLIKNPDFSNCTSIGQAAFQRCATFETLVIPASTAVSIQAFRRGTIVSLTIKGENRQKIEMYTYNDIDTLKTIIIESRNLQAVYDSAFASCHNVETIRVDLSNCTEIGGSAFVFNDNYQNGTTNTWTKWYNLEDERIIDLSSAKTIGGAAFGNCNLGGGTAENQWASETTIIWPQALSSIGSQAFRRDNITGLLYLNAVSDGAITAEYWAFNGNNFDTVIINNGVTISCRFAAKCTVVCLDDNVKFTDDKVFEKSDSTLYYKSIDSTGTDVTVKANCIQITSGSVLWTRTCGIYATVQTADGAVKVGTDTHEFNFVEYNNSYCPINVMGDYYCDKCKNTKQEIAVENYEGVTPTLGHDMSVLFDIGYGNGIINTGNTTMKCADCENKETTEGDANAIITFKGYSAKIGGPEMLVEYKIDKEALANYKSVNSDFSLGVTARILSADGASDELVEIVEGKAQATAEKSIVAEVADANVTSVLFKITGFSLENHYSLALAMCMYVADGEAVDYICQNAEGVLGQYSVAYATTFNEQATSEEITEQ